MREAKVAPSVISYNAGISAGEKRGQWQQAFVLLSAMLDAKLGPDVVGYGRRAGPAGAAAAGRRAGAALAAFAGGLARARSGAGRARASSAPAASRPRHAGGLYRCSTRFGK
ncbi:unnamed protein product [Prorocentrum cordatum]|uniref:Uncharacterized protein n=1 Tax=Prorocentrum cordatum TaxID=2364126 RepID=A0ABN9WJQ6_9DINO|nr:unnamed protein product [Polarella glacialis]